MGVVEDKKFKEKTPTFKQWSTEPDFHLNADYHDIRAFLNICELIAVGIHEKAFSNRVSYAYWGDVLPETYKAAEPLIERIRNTLGEGTRHTYSDLQKLVEAWSSKAPTN